MGYRQSECVSGSVSECVSGSECGSKCVIRNYNRIYGRVSEWSNVRSWKGRVAKATGGSNPLSSAIFLVLSLFMYFLHYTYNSSLRGFRAISLPYTNFICANLRSPTLTLRYITNRSPFRQCDYYTNHSRCKALYGGIVYKKDLNTSPFLF